WGSQRAIGEPPGERSASKVSAKVSGMPSVRRRPALTTRVPLVKMAMSKKTQAAHAHASGNGKRRSAAAAPWRTDSSEANRIAGTIGVSWSERKQEGLA